LTATTSVLPCVTTADVDGDGRPDLVVGDSTAGVVRVLRNQGSIVGLPLTWFAAQSYATGAGTSCPVVGDFNGDGLRAIAVAHHGANPDVVTVLTTLAVAPGSFPTVRRDDLAAGAADHLVAADVDGDGIDDLVVAATNPAGLAILPGS